MTDYVVDASVLAYALIGKTAAADELRTKLRCSGCHAPHLVDAEVGNVLRRLTRAHEITAAHAHTALHAAVEIIDYRYPHTGQLAESAWAFRDNLSFYDALYVALATRLEIPLITADRRLSKAPGLTCAIELI